ncbi:MAG: 30S ribosomal protein S19e [Thaumarchaeota archaeon]|nr:30S ribosomal protein S19e [Nitrososphaerota archaeon]
MVNAYDVPARELLSALTEKVKTLPTMEVPGWASIVKTGSHAERPPHEASWWYARAASILRKLYLHGPLGLSEFQISYGGAKTTGYSYKHHRDSGSSAIRKILKQLEQAELVAKTPKGRVLTPKGTALLDGLSRDIFKNLTQQNPGLARYG